MTIHRDGLYCVTLYYIGQHCIAMVYNVDSTLQCPLQLRGLQVVGAHEWSTTILVDKSPYIVIRMVMMIMIKSMVVMMMMIRKMMMTMQIMRMMMMIIQATSGSKLILTSHKLQRR